MIHTNIIRCLRNLMAVKTKLMDKNVIDFLNYDTKFFIDIMRIKYRAYKIWSNFIPSNHSWLYRSFCNLAKIISPNIWIKSFNANNVRFLFWSMVLWDPLAIWTHCWDSINMEIVLSSFMNFPFLDQGLYIDLIWSWHWVWLLASDSNKLM